MNKEKTKSEIREEKIRKLRAKREICFAILFEMTFSEDTIEQILENANKSKVFENIYIEDKKTDKECTGTETEEDSFSIETDEFIMNILNSFSQHKEEIDEIIKSHIKGWTIERLSRVTLSVLRFAITELKYCKTSEKIVINEAVELSKKYSTPQDARFVNGVLGAVAVKSEA